MDINSTPMSPVSSADSKPPDISYAPAHHHRRQQHQHRHQRRCIHTWHPPSRILCLFRNHVRPYASRCRHHLNHISTNPAASAPYRHHRHHQHSPGSPLRPPRKPRYRYSRRHHLQHPFLHREYTRRILRQASRYQNTLPRADSGTSPSARTRPPLSTSRTLSLQHSSPSKTSTAASIQVLRGSSTVESALAIWKHFSTPVR